MIEPRAIDVVQTHTYLDGERVELAWAVQLKLQHAIRMQRGNDMAAAAAGHLRPWSTRR